MQANSHFNKKSTLPNYVRRAPWDIIQKVNSRIITIIGIYRETFERQSIPEDSIYVSLCGAHYKNDKPIKGELGHLIESGLIQPHQYFGIDREKEIIDQNRIFYPDNNWINGDFLEVLENIIMNNSNIAVINYDGVMQPRNSTQYLKKIMTLVDYNIDHELMLIVNFVLTNPYINSTKLDFSIHDALKELKDLYWMPNHWHLYPESYLYTHSKATMGVLIFLKEKHDIKDIKYSLNRKIGCIGESEIQQVFECDEEV